jgi:hypothetical protein
MPAVFPIHHFKIPGMYTPEIVTGKILIGMYKRLESTFIENETDTNYVGEISGVGAHVNFYALDGICHRGQVKSVLEIDRVTHYRSKRLAEIWADENQPIFCDLHAINDLTNEEGCKAANQIKEEFPPGTKRFAMNIRPEPEGLLIMWGAE